MNWTKYSASGNDFVISHHFCREDRGALARSLCHRQEGIGADGLIVLLPHDTLDFEWDFYNADGSAATMCGNGARAAAHYAYHAGLAPAQMSFLTGAGAIAAQVEGSMVETELTAHTIAEQDIDEAGLRWWLCDTGVPHLVAFGDLAQFESLPLSGLRQKYNANINLATIEADTIKVRTYERGVEGETLACGTGMAACFLRAHEEGRVPNPCRVTPKSGEELTLSLVKNKLHFKGAVRRVFEARLCS